MYLISLGKHSSIATRNCLVHGEALQPLHLKPGHLKMVFFSAWCPLDGAFPDWTAIFPVELP